MTENKKFHTPFGKAQSIRENANSSATGSAAPGLETTAHSWMDAGQRFGADGLPGRIQLSPSVWLCCVYLSPRVAERVDAICESIRLDALLRATIDAWQRHQRAPGASSFVFSFQPDEQDEQCNAMRSSAPGYLIRVQCEIDDGGSTFTRLEFAA